MSRKLPLLLLLIVAVIGIFIIVKQVRPQPVPDATSSTDTESDNLDEVETLVAFANCMQDNGVPDYPDPQNDGINLNGTGVDPNSPDFHAAQAVCESLLPQPRSTPHAEGQEIVPGNSPWEKVVPGGDCHCANGSEFAFWVRPADPTKVVLFLEGGGACWDATTCAFSDANSTTYDWNVTGGDDPMFQSGIFDLSHPDNPFADYSFVFVPYCTGDVHLGNRTQAYSPELTVSHNGFVNSTTALAYLTDNYPDADQVVVVGVSAGSVAAPVYGGLVSDALPEAQITVFADSSGAYPDDPDLNTDILGLWGTFETMPGWDVNEELTAQDWGIPRFWIQAGLHDPKIVMARFDHAFDQVQADYMTMIGLDASNLIASINANEAAIEDAGVIQYSYTAPGNNHGVFSDEAFYRMAINGVTLVEWVEALIAGEPPADVHCDECLGE